METKTISNEIELLDFGENFLKETLAPLTSRQATICAMSGDLGAGKTTFVQKLAAILGVKESVVSPTFVIQKTYQTNDDRFKKLVHIDAYRLEADSELEILGFSKALQMSNTLICIEWAEKVSQLLPKDNIFWLDFTLTEDEARTVKITTSKP